MTGTKSFRLFSVAGAFLVGIWLPLRLIGFVPPLWLEIIFDSLISMISAVNLYLYFQDSEDSPRDLKSWMNPSVVLDLICLVPFGLIAFLYFPQFLSSILFLNLFTARHVYQIRAFLDEFDSLQPIVYRLAPLIVALPMLVHLIACAWIALGSGSAGVSDDKILTYVKSAYWTFTTLTTVGYGDIVAQTIPQMLFTCFVQFLGVAVFGYILSNVAGLLARSDAAREHHMDNLDKVETFMRIHQIPPELRSKIRSYYHYIWKSRKGYQDTALLESLPTKIQSDLFLHINRSIIDKVPFFKGADPEMLSDLMNELEPRVCVPSERIFKVGDKGDALYFIHSGDVEIISPSGEVIAHLTEGAFFGEMALISDKPRTATVRAAGYCDLYALSKESFDRVTKAYPSFLEHIHEVMRRRAA